MQKYRPEPKHSFHYFGVYFLMQPAMTLFSIRCRYSVAYIVVVFVVAKQL